MAECILFEHKNFRGAHRHIFDIERDLKASDDSFFNDRASSMVILSGIWQLHKDVNLAGGYPEYYGPGLYSSLERYGVENDQVSSLAGDRDDGYLKATVHGSPLQGHLILFEHTNLHGAHKHVFRDEPNLNASDDNFFNDRVSSLVVLEGTWSFYKDSNYRRRFSEILQLGINPAVSKTFRVPFAIENDAISSLRPTDPYEVTNIYKSTGEMIKGHAILFQHDDFRGKHKHVINSESNLNAKDDNFFNDRVSSLVIESGFWNFYKDSDYRGQFKDTIKPGKYPRVGSIRIKDNEISSLKVIQ